MNRQYVSRRSNSINASAVVIWNVLTRPEIASQYFHGAKIRSNWAVGSSITFEGEFRGNAYFEKGVILQCCEFVLLQYTHWSDLEGLPDAPEHYRVWTFELSPQNAVTELTITEDNIPTEKQRDRSDEFWDEVLSGIKGFAEDASVS